MTDRTRDGKVTGRKINHLFFVRIKNIKKEDGFYVFLLNDVKQIKPTLCVHMKIVLSREELIQFYREKIGKMFLKS